ncbi:MAG: TRAP transporter substrate-binding protein DctP [Nitrospirota bacterium]|nr:TRAP transporter substrate-binding protein DctP [Nitrospirota bacterium]
MRAFAVLLLTAGMVLSTVSPGWSLTIKLSTLAPEGSPWHQIIRDMADEWEEISEGRVKIRIYAGGVAGDEHDMVRKMRVGQLQAAVISGEGMSGVVPDVQVLQLPMLLQSNAELDYVRDRIAPQLEAAFEAKGFKILNWGDAGWVRLFADHQVTDSSQRGDLKLFSWNGDPAFIDAWKSAGFQPVPMQATELHPALSSGLVNSFITTPLAALSFQWFGQAKHMLDIRWLPLVGSTVIHSRAWDKIPDDLKPKLAESARRSGDRLRRETRELDDKAISVMQEYGLQVHSVTDVQRRQWEGVARDARPLLVGPIVPPGIAAEATKLRDEFRASQK